MGVSFSPAIFQADMLRGLNGRANSALAPLPGRRVIPTPMHDALSENVLSPGAPAGSLKIGNDGSREHLGAGKPWRELLPDWEKEEAAFDHRRHMTFLYD